MKSASRKQLTLSLGKKRRQRQPRRRRRGADGKLVPLGRRPKAERVGFMPHDTRAPHHAQHPVHVTIRRVALGPSFRTQLVCGAIRGVIAAAKRKGVRVLHYSVQENHIHLMAEAESAADLSSQMRTLFSRIARAVNAVTRRRGRLFRDRHHRHALTSPREVRNALVYILFNDRKHRPHGANGASAPTVDRCSSVYWMHDWAPDDRPPEGGILPLDEAPTSRPRTWLARWGWHRGAPSRLLRFSESPRRITAVVARPRAAAASCRAPPRAAASRRAVSCLGHESSHTSSESRAMRQEPAPSSARTKACSPRVSGRFVGCARGEAFVMASTLARVRDRARIHPESRMRSAIAATGTDDSRIRSLFLSGRSLALWTVEVRGAWVLTRLSTRLATFASPPELVDFRKKIDPAWIDAVLAATERRRYVVVVSRRSRSSGWCSARGSSGIVPSRTSCRNWTWQLWGILLAYNLVRLEMVSIAKEADVEPTEISFVESLRLIRDEWEWLSVRSPGAIPKRLESDAPQRQTLRASSARKTNFPSRREDRDEQLRAKATAGRGP